LRIAAVIYILDAIDKNPAIVGDRIVHDRHVVRRLVVQENARVVGLQGIVADQAVLHRRVEDREVVPSSRDNRPGRVECRVFDDEPVRVGKEKRSASSYIPIQILEEHLADRAIGMNIVVILAQGIEILDREIRKSC
jgi:hypothetical protein